MKFTASMLLSLMAVFLAVGSILFASIVPGPQGPMGPIGLTGATGQQGVAGPIGIRGPNGPMGNNGSQGIQGPPGPSGKWNGMFEPAFSFHGDSSETIDIFNVSGYVLRTNWNCSLIGSKSAITFSIFDNVSGLLVGKVWRNFTNEVAYSDVYTTFVEPSDCYIVVNCQNISYWKLVLSVFKEY